MQLDLVGVCWSWWGVRVRVSIPPKSELRKKLGVRNGELAHGREEGEERADLPA